MKKIITCSVLLLVFCTVSFGQQMNVTSSQESPFVKECKITYEVTYPDGGAVASLPVSQTVWIKNDMIRVESKSSTGTAVTIVDCKNKVATTLTDVHGKKYAVKTTAADVQKESEQIPHLEVQQMDDFKFIAGNYCQKYTYSITDNNNKAHPANIYVNNKVIATTPNWYIPALKEIKGVMFEYLTFDNGITTKYTAKTIEPFTDSEDIFKIPVDYKPATKAEMAGTQAK